MPASRIYQYQPRVAPFTAALAPPISAPLVSGWVQPISQPTYKVPPQQPPSFVGTALLAPKVLYSEFFAGWVQPTNQPTYKAPPQQPPSFTAPTFEPKSVLYGQFCAAWIEPPPCGPLLPARSNRLSDTGEWFVQPLAPNNFPLTGAPLIPFPAQPQPQRLKWTYWQTGSVLVVNPPDVPNAQIHVDAWFVQAQMPVRRAHRLDSGIWVGVLEPTKFLIPSADCWLPNVPEVRRRLPLQQPDSFTYCHQNFTPTVPSMATWFQPTQQPVFRLRPTPGEYVIGVPPSLLATTTPCPYRPPTVDDSSNLRVTVDDVTTPRSTVDDGSYLPARRGGCC